MAAELSNVQTALRMPASSKPEQPTLPERLILASHLPYPLGCIIMGFFLLTLAPLTLAYLVGTGSISATIGAISQPDVWAGGMIVPYLFYAPHYMRTRLLRSERKLSALLPHGQEDFHRLFGRVSAVRPQLALWLGLALVLLVYFNTVDVIILSSRPVLSSNPSLDQALQAANLVTFATDTFVLSGLIWIYYTILRGIHQMGNVSMNLSPFYRDQFLGLKPVGSLALSLATAFFGLPFIFVISGFVSPLQAVDIITTGGVLISLVVIGVLAFFLPLRQIHARMLQQKTVAREALGNRIAPIIETDRSDHSTQELLRVELMDRKVSQIATWPFDFQILGKMTVITLSVTAALLTRLIVTHLGL